MSVVSLLGVSVLNNPAKFTDSYQLEVTFECLEKLEKDLEWRLTYVGSATSDQHDQELDSLFVGPVPVGVNKFIFEAKAPDTSRIPDNEIVGVTVVLLSCSYDSREFVRVGYYVNNEYDDQALVANPPAKPIVERVRRNVLAEKPRVTRFAIKWDSEATAPALYPPEQPEADLAADEEEYGAEEAAEEAAALAEAAKATAAAGGGGGGDDGMDMDMGGNEGAAATMESDDDEEEDDDEGSVDLENESEDDLDDDDDEGDAAEGADAMEEDSMEVDDAKMAAGGHAGAEVMTH